MKQHTNNFKNNMKKMGRQFESVITLSDNTELKEELFSVHYSYDGNILKSVMKVLEVESNTLIPIGTRFNYKLGLLVGNQYEYLDYGNFYVYDYELQEDSGNYKITCYDKLLLSMTEYKGINATFPITIRNYINSLCQELGITFSNSEDNFANYNRVIESDLYADLGYTYRDILDELAQVTASTICINQNDELEIRYINNTLDTIDEEFLKDTNVAFGEKYGPINSIVLSRSAESDNVYLRDEDSISQNGLCEIKIKDNQIMNFNDRSDYLPDILQKLDGLEFYINDFNSTGICYYELCDRYSIQVGDNTYSCIMLNDEINVNQGLEEIIYTNTLEESETDYTKADKTDRRLNQTYLIVNKQNQTIEALANEVEEYDDRIASVELTTQSIETLVRDEIDITRTVEGTDPLTIENCLKGYLLELHIYGNNQVFEQLYPSDNLYPSDDLYPMGDSRIHIFTDNKCPDSVSDWWNGYFNVSGIEYHNDPWNEAELICDFIPISELQCYLSLENSDYKFWSWTPYDENKTKIMSGKITINVSDYEKKVTFPTGTKYIRIGIVKSDYHYNETGYENNYPSIVPAEILNIKPMITYSTEKLEYSGYNNSIIELGVTDVLRRFVKQDNTVVRDEYKLINNKGYVIRRVGIDSSGNLYDLETEITQELGETIIPVAEGKNYFNIVNYNANCKLVWVIRNNYTNTFATTVELESSITQLANSINLQVSKKVNNNEVIARINMAILGRDEAEVPDDIEKSIIEILANKISITSDYFSITSDGIATFIRGLIGNWNLLNGDLYSDHIESGNTYRSGMVSRNNTNMFLYSGLLASAQYIEEANFYVTNAGLCKAKWFEVNGESGYFYVNYNSGKTALQFTKEGIYWKLDNSANNEFSSMVITANGNYLRLYDSPGFFVRDDIHNQSLLSINRYRPEAGVNQAFIELHQKTYYYAGGSTGYEIATRNDICDEKVKKNIKQSNESALDKINKIEFKQFDWDKTKINREGHIDIGITAQQVKEIDENFVDTTTIYSTNNTKNGEDNKTEQELLTINTLNLLTTSMKAIQELSEIVNNQQKKIEALEEEINKLKGEK